MSTDERVRASLREAVERAHAGPDLEAIARGVRRGRRRRMAALGGVAMLLTAATAALLTGAPAVVFEPGGEAAAPRPDERGPENVDVPPPPDDVEEGVYHPDEIRVDPEHVRPGDEVAVFFPRESTRGYTFWMERRREVGFHPPEWVIEPDFAQVDQAYEVPRYGRADEPFFTPDGDVWGPGPDRVRVSPEAQPGEYRLCAEWDDALMCARLIVQD